MFFFANVHKNLVHIFFQFCFVRIVEIKSPLKHFYFVNTPISYSSVYSTLILCCDIHRWADKLCLHCNIFIYIRHIWIKPVLCSRMVSLFHHTSPGTHTCLQSSPSAHQNGRVFRCSVQAACCY